LLKNLKYIYIIVSLSKCLSTCPKKVIASKEMDVVIGDRGKERTVEWIDIGVEGLLTFILGLPKGDAILVRGEPCTGKTMLYRRQ
jgi:hypothetical protein